MLTTGKASLCSKPQLICQPSPSTHPSLTFYQTNETILASFFFKVIMPQHVLSERPDLPSMTHLRPAEIKTYHQQSYDRISPSKTFDGKGKTVLVTAGGLQAAGKVEQSLSTNAF